MMSLSTAIFAGIINSEVIRRTRNEGVLVTWQAVAQRLSSVGIYPIVNKRCKTEQKSRS